MSEPQTTKKRHYDYNYNYRDIGRDKEKQLLFMAYLHNHVLALRGKV